MKTEIEHKYLLSGCPDFALQNPPVLIEQGWVSRLRLRKKVDETNRKHYFGCLKFGKGLVRSEYEYKIPSTLFYFLWPFTRGRRVKKLRYAVTVTTAYGPRTWEIDVFLDRTLFLAEIEIPFAGEPIQTPLWLLAKVVREVTDDPSYTNLELAK